MSLSVSHERGTNLSQPSQSVNPPASLSVTVSQPISHSFSQSATVRASQPVTVSQLVSQSVAMSQDCSTVSMTTVAKCLELSPNSLLSQKSYFKDSLN